GHPFRIGTRHPRSSFHHVGKVSKRYDVRVMAFVGCSKVGEFSMLGLYSKYEKQLEQAIQAEADERGSKVVSLAKIRRAQEVQERCRSRLNVMRTKDTECM